SSRSQKKTQSSYWSSCDGWRSRWPVVSTPRDCNYWKPTATHRRQFPDLAVLGCAISAHPHDPFRHINGHTRITASGKYGSLWRSPCSAREVQTPSRPGRLVGPAGRWLLQTNSSSPCRRWAMLTQMEITAYVEAMRCGEEDTWGDYSELWERQFAH